jgi:hypothetical protein
MLKFILYIAMAVCLHATPVCSSGTWSGTTCTAGSRPITYTFSGGAATLSEYQAVLNDSQLGDTILTPSGATIAQGSTAATYTKRSGSGTLTIKPEAYAKLPPQGTRITPAYIPLMTTFTRTGSATMFGFEGGWQPVEGIVIEGMRFKTDTSVAFTGVFSAAMIGIGPASGGDISGRPQCTGKIGPDFNYTDTRLTSAASIGGTSLAVTAGSTTGATPGDILYLSSSSGTLRAECVEIDTIVGDTINLVNPLTVDHDNADYVRVIPNKPEHLPNDIVFRHVIFDNETGQIRNRRYINPNTRAFTIEDSILDRAMDFAASDSQLIHSSVAEGPHTITNNWLCGAAEQVMYGGSYPAFDTELQSANIDYNYFCFIEERDRTTAWPGAGVTLYKGRFVHPTGHDTDYGWFVATNTGITTDTEPPAASWNISAEATFTETGSCSTAGAGGTNACITWRRTGVGNKPLTKNHFEIKSGRNQHLDRNVFEGWWEAVSYNTNQQFAIQIKAVDLDVTSNVACEALTDPYPACYEGKTDGFHLTNSVLRYQTGGAWSLTSYTRGGGTHWYDLLIDNVLVTRTAPTLRLFFFNAMMNLTGTGGSVWPANAFTIRNVTATNTTTSTTGTSYSEWFPNEASLGGNYIFGNIFGRGTAGMTGGAAGAGEGITGTNPPTLYGNFDRVIGLTPYTSTFFSNMIIGAPTTAYPSSSIVSNCSSSSSCTESTAWTYNHPTHGLLFRDYANGDYRVRPTNTWAKNTLPDGRSVGANLSLLPLINNLAVQPTDRMALFTWNVTEANKDMGCIVDVNSQADFLGSYVGDQSSISTYYGTDQSDHDNYIKRGLDRMVVVGKNVNLSPSTTYYYRLHCGGDMRRGSFTTSASVSSTATVKISKAGAATMTYGTYSRATDALSGGGSGSCASDVCTAALNRGEVTFYRLDSGRVQATVVK